MPLRAGNTPVIIAAWFGMVSAGKTARACSYQVPWLFSRVRFGIRVGVTSRGISPSSTML